MRAHALTIASELRSATPPGTDPHQAREASRFLEWLAHNNFTFLGYREYSLAHENGKDVSRQVPGTGLGLLRYDRPSAGKGLVLTPAASRAARDSTHPHHHQGQLARDGPPRRLPRLHLDQALRRPRRVRRRAALPRPLRLGRLQRHHPRHPAARRAGAGGAAPHRPQRRQPLGQGHPPDPRDLPARRALPDEPGAARRDRDERAAPPGAPQDQALPAPRRVRPLRLVPRLPPARPLQHDGAPAHRGDPARGLRRREHRQHDARQRVGARPPALRRPYAGRYRHPRRRRGGDRAARHRRDPHLGRGPLRGARPGARPRGRGADDGGVRQGPARGVQGGLRRRDRGRGPRPHRRARRGRPHDGAAPLRRPRVRRPARAALQALPPGRPVTDAGAAALHAPRRRGDRRAPLRGARSRRPHAAHLRLRPVRRRADVGVRRRGPRTTSASASRRPSGRSGTAVPSPTASTRSCSRPG